MRRRHRCEPPQVAADSRERKEAFDSILVSGKTLLGLINDLLDLSKLESGKMEINPEPTDCPHLLRELMDAFGVSANRPGLELRSRIGDFDIVTATDGRIALDILQSPESGPFDLVLTDIWMPNLDGEGLVKAIRADSALSSLRVIAVTANVALRGKADKMGFDGIVLKPITTSALEDVVFGE